MPLDIRRPFAHFDWTYVYALLSFWLIPKHFHSSQLPLPGLEKHRAVTKSEGDDVLLRILDQPQYSP